MSATKSDRYRAVTVKACRGSCQAAKQYSGKKLLLDEFDSVILKHCHEAVCPCQFEQHTDRRSGLDRRYLNADAAQPINASNRRLSYGRRVEDVHNRARDKTGEMALSQALHDFLQLKSNA